jgi:class 3 adenylate cyclase/pimeloyl-ACP methyl ester carboxylesterase
VEVPDVHYARSGDVAIAYQVVGAGPTDLVFLPFVSSLWWLWTYPHFSPFANRLAESSRLVLVNTRGMGLSDRPRGVTIEARMDDVLAVLGALEIERCTLLGIGETAATCIVFAASYPERVERLIVHIPFVRGIASEEYPWAPSRDEWLEIIRVERERWGEREFLEESSRSINPQWADDPDYREHFVWFNRHSLSPGAALEFRRLQMELDVTDVLSAVHVPTLVLSKERLRDSCAYAADRIPDAHMVDLPGEGLAIFEHDGVYAAEAIEAFLRGESPAEVPDSVLATILFTDLVGSTEKASELGDRAWRELLAKHHAVVRRELARFRGEERDTAGDGFFATFDGPARAIRAAQAIVGAVRELGLEIRAGVHTAECEVHDGKVAGIAVSTGARVAAVAAPGEVLVSSTVKDLVPGSGIDFEERGTHELKGVPGEWRLYAVSSA